MNRQTGKLILISGPSGTGKSTVISRLMRLRDDVCFSVSATTRAPRPGEVEGVHYYFRTREEFEQTIENDGFLEYAEYNGNYYGTLKSHVRDLQDNGKTVILEIEVDGAMQVKKKLPDAITVFMTAPSVEEVERRLRGRNTECEEVIQKRLAIAKDEMAHAAEYDYVVCNDSVENAANRILDILKD